MGIYGGDKDASIWDLGELSFALDDDGSDERAPMFECNLSCRVYCKRLFFCSWHKGLRGAYILCITWVGFVCHCDRTNDEQCGIL